MKKKIISFGSFEIALALILFLVSTSIGYSQPNSQKIDSVYTKKEMKSISDVSDGNGWIHFKKALAFNESNFFEEHKMAFGLGTKDKMILKKTTNDKYGYSHSKYYQTYNGIKVEHSDVIIHSKDGFAEKANGVPVLGLSLDTKPKITSKQAIDIALNYVHADKYAWDDAEMSKFAKYPTAELVILPIMGDNGIIKNVLTYKMDIFAIVPSYRSWIYVDAGSGKIVSEKSRIINTSATGTVKTLYSGYRELTSELQNGNYFLDDFTNGNEILTVNFQGTTTNGYYYYDNNSNFSKYSGSYNYGQFDAQWGIVQTYKIYKEIFQRNSFDDNGASIYSYMRYGNSLYDNNAAWNGAFIGYGLYNPLEYRGALSCIDIVAHEYTHAVTQYSANLEYEGESGALNEGFSDIMGTYIEFKAKKEEGLNWLLGNEISLTNKPFRSLSNPKDYKLPNTYGGDYWINTQGCIPSQTNDQCGVHRNLGVLDFWFYLLSEGGSDENENKFQYNVTGIGIDKAAKIAYRTLTVYLTSNSNYSDARHASIEAARDIFGICSDEIQQVVNAWDAVGVTNSITVQQDISVCGTIPNGKHYIGTNIYASDNCTEGNAILYMGTSSTMQAGSSIILKPGFYANYGSTLQAEIIACNGGGVLKNEVFDNEEISSTIENSIKDELKQETDIILSPNPTTGLLKISSSNNIRSVKINNSLGVEVYAINNINEGLLTLDISSFAKGIYFISIQTDGETIVKSIIKE